MSACTSKQSCDLICFNGRIHTIDGDDRIEEAFAVSEGRFVAIGDNSTILSGWSCAKMVDLGKRNVYPGFIDAHAHLYGLGEEEITLQLIGSTSIDDVLGRLRDHLSAQKGETWIRGRGWDQNDWNEKLFPRKEDLDAIISSRPVFLSRIDGHAVWVNSRALEISGITGETPDPEGGRILRDENGEATGILLDNAIELVRRHIPPATVPEILAAYRSAIARCLALGITGIHDMGMHARGIEAIRMMIAQNEFPFHLIAYIDDENPETWESLLHRGRQVIGNSQLTLAGLKLYADGALGSRGAWLLEEYADDPGNRGIAIVDEKVIAYEAARALPAGLQICVHAIGDAAVRRALDAYEAALTMYPPSPYPLRIEHAQVISMEDIPRFASLGVVPSMQPTHCTSDMTWAEARLGARRVQVAYPWNTLILSGAYIPGGSDFPVERPDPLAGIYAAAFRMDAEGRPASQAHIDTFFQTDQTVPDLPARREHGWFADQCMSRADAIRAFTVWAARAGGVETERGSIEAGKWADFVILSRDLTTVAREDFLASRVLATYVAGKAVYRHDQ